MSTPEENSTPPTEAANATPFHNGETEPPLAYHYPHATDHPPVAPIPDNEEHDVKSYGGAPEGGT